MNNNLSKLYAKGTKRHYRPSKLFRRRRIIISVFFLSLILLLLFPVKNFPATTQLNCLLLNMFFSLLIVSSLIINIIILRPISSKNWTYFKEIVLAASTTIVSVILILGSIQIIFPDQISKKLIIEASSTGMFFGFFIYITINFFTLQRYVLNKTPLNIELSDTLLVEIIGKNKNERLLIPIKNLMYIKSEGHYINIFYSISENDNIKNILFRENISNIQKRLTSYETLYRCHKSYLVNTDHIKYINSYGGKYHIVLKSGNIRIPVSTSKADYLVKKIKPKN